MARAKNPAAVALGRLGRAAKTEAQAAASRQNGARGGRPRGKDGVGVVRLMAPPEVADRLREAAARAGHRSLTSWALAVLSAEADRVLKE